jgi:hypothetical protein
MHASWCLQMYSLKRNVEGSFIIVIGQPTMMEMSMDDDNLLLLNEIHYFIIVNFLFSCCHCS